MAIRTCVDAMLMLLDVVVERRHLRAMPFAMMTINNELHGSTGLFYLYVRFHDFYGYGSPL